MHSPPARGVGNRRAAGIVINSLIAVVLLGWAILLFTSTTSAGLRASGLLPAAILIAGRALSFAPATYIAAV